MMKSWADHCSSDEEDSVADDNPRDDLVDDTAAKLQVDGDDDAVPVSPEEEVVVRERVYEFPTQPPFTAFVGNLSYDIKDAPMLIEAVSNVAKDRLSEPVNVMGGRVAYHRTTDSQGKHRGFGYVEVETLDQLKLLMTLNEDKGAMIAGRNVQMDTANHQNHNNNNNNNSRRGSQGNRGSFQRGGSANREEGHTNKSDAGGFGNVDGSKFRGGKFNNQNRSNDNRRRDTDSRSSFQNNNNPRGSSESQESSGPPPQRPSLKLAPRSKPVESADGASSTASNIFGGARARDEQAWQQKRASVQKEPAAAAAAAKDVEATASSTSGAEKKEKAELADGAGKDRNASRSSGQFQEQRHSGRGRDSGAGRGRTGGRGTGGRGGGGRHDKSDSAQNKRGSRRNASQQQQEKKQSKQQSPEEKAAEAAAKLASVATVAEPAPKKTEASNKFALLMDSDSE